MRLIGLSLAGLAAFATTEAQAQQPAPLQLVQPVTMLPNDYPVVALRAGIEGDSRILLTVAPDGRVAECRTEASAGHAALDAAACNLYKARARFNRVDGTASRMARTVVAWRLADNEYQAPGSLDFLGSFSRDYGVQLGMAARISDGTECRNDGPDVQICPIEVRDGRGLLPPLVVEEIHQEVNDLGVIVALAFSVRNDDATALSTLNGKLGTPCLVWGSPNAGNFAAFWRVSGALVAFVDRKILVQASGSLRDNLDAQMLAPCL